MTRELYFGLSLNRIRCLIYRNMRQCRLVASVVVARFCYGRAVKIDHIVCRMLSPDDCMPS